MSDPIITFKDAFDSSYSVRLDGARIGYTRKEGQLWVGLIPWQQAVSPSFSTRRDAADWLVQQYRKQELV